MRNRQANLIFTITPYIYWNFIDLLKAVAVFLYKQKNSTKKRYSMNKLLFLFLSSVASCTLYTESGVVYQLNGGRFGDNLKSYAQAKWLSYINSLPFFYVSFPYSDQLMMDVYETKYTKKIRKMFSKIVPLPANNYALRKDKNYLYISTFYTKMSIDWNDQQFIDELRKNISPRYAIEKIAIPEGSVSVAIHIRTGGGYAYDDASIQKKFPLRFAPIEFYTGQLTYIAQLFKEQQLYVHIFTDHPDPQELVHIFKTAIGSDHITYGYREDGNSHSCNIIQDFFAMMEFDCLIRPGSNFSRFVERIGNNKLVIFPTKAEFISCNEWIISEFKILERTEHGWNMTRKRRF